MPRRAPLEPAAFRALCEEAPLQGAAGRPPRPSFRPLTVAEEPRTGMLLGLDAEFVALSQPEIQVIGCAPPSRGSVWSVSMERQCRVSACSVSVEGQ